MGHVDHFKANLYFKTILNHLIMEKQNQTKYYLIFFLFFLFEFFINLAWFKFIFNLKACEKHQKCIFKTLDYHLILKKNVTCNIPDDRISVFLK